MIGFLVRRGATVGATAVVAISLAFVFFKVTIDGITAPDEVVGGLGDYLERLVLHGDLGTSALGTEPPVKDVIRDGLAVDMTLLLGGTVVAAAWGIPCGLWCAARPRSRSARALDLLAAVVLSAPVPFVAFGILIMFANSSGIVVRIPFVSGQGDAATASGDPLAWARAMWVPVVVVGAPLGAQLLRMAAGAVGDALGEEFVRTARAKGVSGRHVICGHALPYAATPLAMMAGVNVNLIVTNVLLTEASFNLPGSFRFLDDAFAKHDSRLLSGLVLEWTLVIVLANFGADAYLRWRDPRVRIGR